MSDVREQAMIDFASECAGRWYAKWPDVDGPAVQDLIEGAVREALAKAADRAHKNGDIRTALAIRALGAKS